MFYTIILPALQEAPSYSPCSSLEWGEEISFSKGTYMLKFCLKMLCLKDFLPDMLKFKKASVYFMLIFAKHRVGPFFSIICFPSSFVVQSLSCIQLCDPMDCITPSFPVLHYFLECAQIHVHWASDAIQPSYLLLSPSPPALNLSQHQGLFQCVTSSHPVAKVLELQLQHQSLQWIFRVDFF